ncbi:MAG: formate dehydrogenase subunit gamma [Geminicoccaceae bacterium]
MKGCKRWAGLVLLALWLGVAAVTASVVSSGVALAQEQGRVPGQALGNTSDADFWREIRRGQQGSVSIPNQEAGVMIQSQGEAWRSIHNGPLSTYGVWGLLAIIALLALFFLLRGRVRIERGRSGRLITRFNALERFTHWLTASCFVVLALTGLNLLYGRYWLRPLIGADAFSLITLGGKYAHDFLAFGFMLGLVLMFVLWIAHNIPNRYDLIWLAKGGGMFKRGVHAPAKKFNAGQKIIFSLVILLGISVSLSGIMLLFPFRLSMFGETFGWVNWVFGTEYPTQLAPLQEMQFAQVWHAIIGLFLTIVIIAHIYIGTVGMEGAFDAMGSGKVDENWAREHHDLWVRDLERKDALGSGDD